MPAIERDETAQPPAMALNTENEQGICKMTRLGEADVKYYYRQDCLGHLRHIEMNMGGQITLNVKDAVLEFHINKEARDKMVELILKDLIGKQVFLGKNLRGTLRRDDSGELSIMQLIDEDGFEASDIIT